MASNLPDYVASAQPVPQEKRIAWYKSTAQTYAGIMLWFVFWVAVVVANKTPGGTLSMGLKPAFIGLIAAALFCHVFYYLAPGMLGLKTGLPLYIVGTSTYGVAGGFLMPGFLMGLLQFGWLGVNAYFSSKLLAETFGGAEQGIPHIVVGAVWAIVAAFVGLKGIKYVAKVATFFPVIPLTILVVLLVSSIGGLSTFDPKQTSEKAVELAAAEAAKTGGGVASPLSTDWDVITTMMTVIIGFFATAGAAGADFGMNNRNGHDVQMGGLVGIAGSTILAGGLALLIVAGAQGKGIAAGVVDPTATPLMGGLVGEGTAKVFMFLLAVAAFPPACFSSFIAANSFKTTLPKVNPFISVGFGTLVSIILVATGAAGKAADVFTVIGASFGPICGAMAADYLLAGKKWAGPRAGFNPAGWISWAVGFLVGGAGLMVKYIPALGQFSQYIEKIPVPPLSAMIVGFVLYLLLAAIGLKTRTLPMPQVEGQAPKAEEAQPQPV